ncbi:MAG: hypothetical protein U0516_01000 [Candidatus Saccharibacteria bacterium]
MKAYRTKAVKYTGRSYSDVERKARKLHNSIAARSKRNPYIRSAYFKNSKIFINLFWDHLHQKPQYDRKRRIKYYAAAIELLRHSTAEPVTKPNPNGRNELVHRFAGQTKDGDLFYVQVKEDNRTDNKYFVSVFPPH